jgi:hypothetical protein
MIRCTAREPFIGGTALNATGKSNDMHKLWL